MVRRRSSRFDPRPLDNTSEVRPRDVESFRGSDVRELRQPQPVFDVQGLAFDSVRRKTLESTPPLLHAGALEAQVISAGNEPPPTNKVNVQAYQYFVDKTQGDYWESSPNTVYGTQDFLGLPFSRVGAALPPTLQNPGNTSRTISMLCVAPAGFIAGASSTNNTTGRWVAEAVGYQVAATTIQSHVGDLATPFVLTIWHCPDVLTRGRVMAYINGSLVLNGLWSNRGYTYTFVGPAMSNQPSLDLYVRDIVDYGNVLNVSQPDSTTVALMINRHHIQTSAINGASSAIIDTSSGSATDLILDPVEHSSNATGTIALKIQGSVTRQPQLTLKAGAAEDTDVGNFPSSNLTAPADAIVEMGGEIGLAVTDKATTLFNANN